MYHESKKVVLNDKETFMIPKGDTHEHENEFWYKTQPLIISTMRKITASGIIMAILVGISPLSSAGTDADIDGWMMFEGCGYHSPCF